MQQAANSKGPLLVEENCWLGINSVLSGNITVGRGNVVAANAVVKSNVPPFSVVGGVPARVLRLYNPASCQWENATTSEAYQRIQGIREAQPLPTREEYRFILRRNAQRIPLDPVVAGRGIHI